MSYCRFSSDDFQCDVYTYEGYDEFVTHVAAIRYEFTRSLPEPVDLQQDARAWSERLNIVMQMVEEARRVPINGPHDGERFSDPTPDAAADRLEQLRAAGYRVPQYAIDALREEATEGNQ